MNSFVSDLRRAILSRGFFAAIVAQFLILIVFGTDSRAFLAGVPFVCTFPYSCAFLIEYRNGFVRAALCRTTYRGYILGKFFAAGISGGLSLVISLWLWALISGTPSPVFARLLFLNGFLWAVVSATLASVSQSRYIAYGSSFVVCFFLVILCERYFPSFYVMHPFEWVKCERIWRFGENSIALMLVVLSAAVMMIYYLVVRRKLKNE